MRNITLIWLPHAEAEHETFPDLHGIPAGGSDARPASSAAHVPAEDGPPRALERAMAPAASRATARTATPTHTIGNPMPRLMPVTATTKAAMAIGTLTST